MSDSLRPHGLQHARLSHFYHCLVEFAQTSIHQVEDAIQPSHPLLPTSLAFSLSQHQGLYWGTHRKLPHTRMHTDDWAYEGFGLPWWLRWWQICLQCGRPGFNPWVGKIPWKRERLPTPVFCPGKLHGRYIVHRVAKSQTRPSDFHFHFASLYVYSSELVNV